MARKNKVSVALAVRATRRWQRALAGYLRHDLVVALVVAIAVICLGVGLGWEGNKLIPLNPDTSARYLLEPNDHLSLLSNWDGPIYLDLAQHGYTSRIQANFFPLYPLTVRTVQIVVRSPLLSGLAVSWLCFVGVLYFYLKILRTLYPRDAMSDRVRAVLLYVLFPTAVFFIATYTESLFAFLALGALYFALKKRWLPAALFALLSGATHLNGLFVVLLIALILFEAKERLLNIAATIVVGSLGVVAYLVFLLIHFHDPLMLLAAQANHSTVHVNPLTLVANIATRNGLFFILLVATVVYWWRKRRDFALYTLLYVLLVFLSSRGMSGLGRYTLAAFPAQLMLYDYFRNRQLGYTVAIALLAVGWAYFTLLYSAGYSGG